MRRILIASGLLLGGVGCPAIPLPPQITDASAAIQKALDDACRRSPGCLQRGECVARDGDCVLGGDADCRQSLGCRQEGRCTVMGGSCGARTPADCAGSLLCEIDGWCSQRGRACVRGDVVERAGPPGPSVVIDALRFDPAGDRVLVRVEQPGWGISLRSLDARTGDVVRRWEADTRREERARVRRLARSFPDEGQRGARRDDGMTLVGAPVRDGVDLLVLQGDGIGLVRRVLVPGEVSLAQVLWSTDGRRVVAVLHSRIEARGSVRESDRVVIAPLDDPPIRWRNRP